MRMAGRKVSITYYASFEVSRLETFLETSWQKPRQLAFPVGTRLIHLEISRTPLVPPSGEEKTPLQTIPLA